MTIGRKFANVYDLGIFHYANDWQEATLTQDMATLSSYFYKGKLKLNTTKTLLAFFHLYNKEARCELNIFVNGLALPFCTKHTYVCIKLHTALTFCRHLESLRKKVASRVGLLKQLTGSSWGTMPQYSAQPPLPWSILRLNTVRLFIVAVPILASSTRPLIILCCSSGKNRKLFFVKNLFSLLKTKN